MGGRPTVARALFALAFVCLAAWPVAGASAAVTFAPEARHAVSSAANAHPSAVALLDADFNGTPDIATANENTDEAALLRNEGAGAFTRFVRPAGDAPQGIAGADLDGDGLRDDVAVANAGSDNVTVLFNFFDTSTFAVGDGPSSIAVGDFNRNGRSDLFTANRLSNDVSVLRGFPSPLFTAGPVLAVGASPASIAVGQFDPSVTLGIDLVTANFADGTVSVIFGDGDGLFPARRTLAVGDSPQAVAVADLSGDGNADIVVANRFTDEVSVLLGNGQGLFSQPTRYPAGDSPRALAVADLSGDGKPDLAVANGVTGDASVLVGDGGGAFGSPRQFAVGSEPVSIAAGDFNGDGAADLVTANRVSNDVSVLLNSASVGLSPTRVAFPDTRVGRRSGSRTVTVTNTGSAPLDVDSVAIEGSGAGSFTVVGETCTTAAVAPGGRCTASVRFVPTATGAAVARLRVEGNALGSPHFVALSGTGTEPDVTLSPTTLAFPATGVGTESGLQSITVRNTGSAPLRVTSVALGGTDAQAFELASQSCTGTTIAVGGTCRANIRFVPTAAGPASATLTVTSDASDSPHAASLSGTGTQPEVALSPSNLTFPDTLVGAQSEPRTVTVTNVGTAALHVSSVALAGANAGSFSIVSVSCTGAPIEPGESCTASVRFAPRASGPANAVLQIVSDAPGSPHAVGLSGRGTQRCLIFGLFCS